MQLLRMGTPSFIFWYQPLLSIFSMAFPHSLSTGEMAEYVTYHFEWDRRRVAFLPSPLLKDFSALCPSYELAVAKEAARHFELPELPQVIFYAMLLNEVERLGVLHRRTLRLNRDRIFEARFWAKVEQKEESSRAGQEEEGSEAEREEESLATEGAASPSDDNKLERGQERERRQRESLCWRRATRPPRPLLNNYQDLCPCFSLPGAERAALDFELPEMVQAMFYIILLNDAIELGIVSGFLTDDLKSTLEGRPLRPGWVAPEGTCGKHSIDSEPCRRKPADHTEQAAEYVQDNFCWKLREPSAPGLRPLPLDYRGLCPRFDLGVVTRYAHDSNIPEMVQAIFYAMVIDDAAKLGLSRRLTMNCVMWAMHKLDWGPVQSWLGDIDCRLRRAQASQPANPPLGPALLGGLIGRRTTSFAAFRNTTHAAKYVRNNLRRPMRESSSLRPNLLPLHFEGLCPEFDYIVVMPFAYAARIPEMVQTIFYAMVINDVAELRLLSRDAMGDMMLALWELR
ncbi:hypothetical protein Cgig2_028170 [Carnegiea gigantea]|uniref:Uncharacterized protein n=1 Tax=Carnegiea gigantea TaxID=171969 RepID=A0A9Q1GXU6_9CARY|nr:hypothetical protein Cgig2_028170 [Carnegiea gigantea]